MGQQGGGNWKPFDEGKNGHKRFCQAHICYFGDKCVVFAHSHKFANSNQYDMQYVPCNRALFAQESLFLTQKSTFLTQSLSKSAQMRQIIMSRQYSICYGLKFSSESKLFGESHSCLRTTSATLWDNMHTVHNTHPLLKTICLPSTQNQETYQQETQHCL